MSTVLTPLFSELRGNQRHDDGTPMYRTCPAIFDPLPYGKGSALLQTPGHGRPGLDSDDERGIVPGLKTTS